MRSVLSLLSLACVAASLSPQVSERTSVALVVVALLLGAAAIAVYAVGEYRSQQPALSAYEVRVAAAKEAERAAERASRRARHGERAERRS